MNKKVNLKLPQYKQTKSRYDKINVNMKKGLIIIFARV